MGQALYRKYRSRSFDEVLGQDHIVKTLKNALKSGRISHAYLFTGPKGVGKTTVARVLAHEVNGLEYTDESIHLDIIEIDAASNRRIDEIRELRERVHIAPTSAKYKVYIIDEVHMLTREAFNALLKTLEEPPAHCIFILATTEAHKLPDTIVSRTQHFSFKPIEQKPATDHLQAIAKAEKIDITPEAIELLAEHANGSFRDSISLLDQLSGSGGKIGEPEVRNLLGLPSSQIIDSLLASIENGDSRATLGNLDGLKEQGVNFAITARLINQRLRGGLLEGQADQWRIKLLRRLSSAAASANPQERVEIDLLEAASGNRQNPLPARVEQSVAVVPAAPTIIEEEQADEPYPDEELLAAEEATETVPVSPKPLANGFSLELWPEVINRVKDQAASLYTALRLAEPRLVNDILTLAFQFPLHQKKVNQAKFIELIGQIIEQISGSKLVIKCEIDKQIKSQINVKKTTPPETTTELNSLNTISNIFGTAEMLES